MLRPMIQAPTLAKPRAVKSSSMPVAPSCPDILRNVRVPNIHSCSASPPMPSGSARLWSGPAPYPSSETEKQATPSFDIRCSSAIVIAICNWLQNTHTDGRMQAVLEGAAMKNANDSEQRSGCPINLTLEVVGDKWSLLVVRDMIFGNRRHFRELLTKSEEGIASNILADRLKRLVEQGIVSKADDPSHKQKAIYSLTEKGIELLPVLAQMSAWGLRHLPVTEELGIRARLLDEGGPRLWAD